MEMAYKRKNDSSDYQVWTTTKADKKKSFNFKAKEKCTIL